VVEKLDKPGHRGGIVVLKAVSKNQKDETVVEAQGKLLVASRPAATP
jgi:acyl dehydratase